MVRTNKRLWLCITLLALNVAFIWGNSLMSAEISKAISGFVRKVLSVLFSGGSGNGVDGPIGEGFLRKCAHFLEFTSLGCLLSWLFAMVNKPRLLAMVSGFGVACIDETIQCFVPGRGPRFTDVLLDSAGVACGIAVLLLLCVTIYKKKQ